MGKLDIITREIVGQKGIFADLCNFNGEYQYVQSY